jgi:hypothetical protein
MCALIVCLWIMLVGPTGVFWSSLNHVAVTVAEDWEGSEGVQQYMPMLRLIQSEWHSLNHVTLCRGDREG